MLESAQKEVLIVTTDSELSQKFENFVVVMFAHFCAPPCVEEVVTAFIPRFLGRLATHSSSRHWAKVYWRMPRPSRTGSNEINPFLCQDLMAAGETPMAAAACAIFTSILFIENILVILDISILCALKPSSITRCFWRKIFG